MTSEFQRVPLTSVLDFREGPGILAVDFAEEGVPLIRLSGLKEGAGILEGCNYLSPAKVDAKWSQFRIKEGDVLLSTSASLGEVAVAGPEAVGAIPYTGIIIFRPKNDAVDPRVIGYLFKTQDFLGQVQAMGAGSVIRHFGPSHLRQMRLVVPPRSHQGGIAEVLGSLDRRILANSRTIALSRQLLTAEFESARRCRGASSVALTSLVTLNPSIRNGVSLPVPYLDMQKLPVSDWVVREWGKRSKPTGTRFQNGDTLLARITPCLENGKLGYVDFLEDGEVGFGSTEFVVLRPKEGVPHPLPYLIASSENFRDYAIQHMYGTSGRQRVVAKDLEEYELTLPPLDQMADFGCRAEAMFADAGALRDESRTLAALRDTLLPALMSGRLSVRDAEAAVSEVV